MSSRRYCHWSEAVRVCEERGRPYVIVTLLGARGSTPRGSGSKMVVTSERCDGSIGGGELEFRAQHRARELLAGGSEAQRLENFPLGEKLGQCCGGSASVLFECFAAERLPVMLFGAGHVGRALAPLLATLPLRLRWIDSRADSFPASTGIDCVIADEPVDALRGAEPGAAYVIMTHRHALDFSLLEAALRRDDASYIGVIGSQSKWRRFRLRLEQRGFSAEALNRVRCPIGLEAVPGKLPAEIAVSVTAQLIDHYHALRAAPEKGTPGWKTQRELLEESGALFLLSCEQDA